MNAHEQAEAHRHNERTLDIKGSTVEKGAADRLRTIAEMFQPISETPFPACRYCGAETNYHKPD